MFFDSLDWEKCKRTREKVNEETPLITAFTFPILCFYFGQLVKSILCSMLVVDNLNNQVAYWSSFSCNWSFQVLIKHRQDFFKNFLNIEILNIVCPALKKLIVFRPENKNFTEILMKSNDFREYFVIAVLNNFFLW